MTSLSYWSAILWAITPTLPEVMAGPHPLVRGTMVDNAAVTIGYLGPRSPFVPAVSPQTRVMLRQPLRDDSATDVYDFTVAGPWWWPSRGSRTPQRWQIGWDRIYVVGLNHFPTGVPQVLKFDQPLLSPSAGLSGYPYTPGALARLRVMGAVVKRPPGPGQKAEQTAPPKDWREVSAKEVYAAVATVPRSDLAEFTDLFDGTYGKHEPLSSADKWRAHFDFLFGIGGLPELYVIAPGRLFRYRSEPSRFGERPAYDWHSVGTYTPGWDGPFYAAVDGRDRHFVVPGGRVFTLPADAQPGSALVKTWDKEPVLALVRDSDAGKSYAFTRTHYFHVTSKPDPKPHDLKAFPGATAEEALDTVAKCGRVIRGIK